MERRDFLKSSALAAGVALLEACGRKQVDYFVQPLERTPGRPGMSVWRTSVCGQCPAGCGTRVRLVDGDPRKVEGLPGHPINHGGLCAIGQASLQGHYNPDRIVAPRMRRGPRGSGDLDAIDWERALAETASALAAAAEADPSTILFLSGRGDAFVDALLDRLAAALGAPASIGIEPPETAVERAACARIPGLGEGLPAYDLARADYVLSIGPAFLDRGRQPAHAIWAMAQVRAGRAGHRGKLVQAEARMSQTGAFADEWLPVIAGTEGVLARAFAGVLLDEGLARTADLAPYQALFPGPAPTPEEAETICGVSATRIRRIARELAAAESPLVLAGGSAAVSAGGLHATTAALALDLLLDAVGRPGGVFPSSAGTLAQGLRPEALPPAPATGELEQRLRDGWTPSFVLLCETDPLHTRPHLAGWQAALEAAETVVVLGSALDDTTLYADLVLPLHSDVERFQAVEPAGLARPVLSLAEAAVDPLGDTRHPGDVILALGRAVDHEDAVPWSSFETAVKETCESAWQESGNAASWSQILEAGFWLGPEPSGAAPLVATAVAETAAGTRESAGGDEMTLLLFETAKLGDGRGANKPWLQELPDTLTTAMWTLWVEVAQADAERLGLATGDILEITSPHGKVQAPAIIRPDARPGTLALPLGGGYREYGRYARGRGDNSLDLLGADLVAETSEPVLNGLAVTMRKVGRREVALFGRGLRDAEEIPTGWAPMETGGEQA